MQNLILIHGALGCGLELKDLQKQLSINFKVHIYEIPGHGNRSDEIKKIDFEYLIEDFDQFFSSIGPSYIFGFSLGGYLALSYAQQTSKTILGIITLGTKFNWSPEEALNETKKLNPTFLKEKASSFYDYLEKLHKQNLKPLLSATEKFMLTLGNTPRITSNSVKSITCPVRICRGGKDKMVTSEESIAIQKNISNSLYFEVPSFIHPIGFLKANLVSRFIESQIQSFSYNFIKTTNYGTISYQKIKGFDENKPILLFLHEALGSIAQWKNFPELLCKSVEHNGIIIELQGYGYSSEFEGKRNSDYLHLSGFKQLPEIIHHIGVKNDIILIGHSDGGTNALFLAKRLPQQIVGVVTMAAHCINEPETRAGIPPAINAFENGKLIGLELYHGKKTSKLFYDWANTWLSDDFEDWNIINDIKNIQVPGLIIQGDKDQYGTKKQVELIAACFDSKSQQKILANCGHSPHLEAQHETIEIITEWIKNYK